MQEKLGRDRAARTRVRVPGLDRRSIWIAHWNARGIHCSPHCVGFIQPGAIPTKPGVIKGAARQMLETILTGSKAI